MNKLLVTLFCIAFGNLTAQEAMEVQRCADIDRRVPINNIFVDGTNNKWVADQQGLFLAQSPEFASTVDIPDDKWSVLSAPDGNIELNLDKGKLQQLMGEHFDNITCAHINPTRKELWIGTNGGGLFQFNVNPGLNLVTNLSSSNSKLRSNHIKTIYINPTGRLYAGTDDGLFSRKGSKESLYSKGFDVTAIAHHNGNLWVIADGEVLEVDKKGDFYEMDIDERKLEGELVDIDFDSDGRLWIASEVVTRYNLETGYYDFFGPAEEFTSQDVMCITIDGDDALWVGTKDKGVYFIGRASTLSATLVMKDLLTCDANAKDGSLQVRASGGQPPYTYKWDNGLQGENPKGLGPGTYAVTVTDKKGNTTKANKTINDPRLEVSISMLKEASLGGGKDGQAEVKVSGGNNNFTFLWDNGETKKTATKLAGGEHVVTITDKGSCSTTATITITEKLAPLSVSIDQTKDIDCNAAATANITANATGGQGPYQYQWSKGNGNNENNNGLPAGNYAITITDANNNTATADISIKEPSKLTVSAKVKSPASTNNADGKAVARGAGGTGKFTYKWDTGESSDVSNKLAAGSHSVTVTDEKGCTATTTFDITEDILPLSVEILADANIKCAGESTGALKADISGGKPPFKYQWSTNVATETVKNLAAGTYQLTITDAAGTNATADISLKEPRALTASTELRAPASTNNADGKAQVKVSGGTGKYTYRWKNGETTATAGKLGAGLHSVVITDENACTATAEIEMTENILAINVSINQTQEIKCFGEKTAALEVKVNGGKPPFKYEWNISSVNGEKASALGAGKYELTLTDAAGATQTKSIEIKEPAELLVSIDKNTPASAEGAKDGRATLTVSGGTPVYAYKWDNGETGERAKKLNIAQHSVSVTDANNCVASAQFETLQKLLPELTAGRLSSGQILQVSRIAFEADSTDVLPSSYPTLNEIALFLQQNPAVVIEVGGHTNNVPPPDFCDKLSTLRAKSVADYITNKGIASDRVVYKGYGKRKPKYSNNHKEGRAKNQRVEIKILSLQ